MGVCSESFARGGKESNDNAQEFHQRHAADSTAVSLLIVVAPKMNALRNFFTPPPLTQDSELNRLAQLLHRLLLGILVTGITIVPLQVILGVIPIWIWIDIFMLGFASVAILVLKAGHVYLTGTMVVIASNGLMAVSTIVSGRPFAIMTVAGIVSIIMMGLLASRRGLLLVMGIGLVATISTTVYFLFASWVQPVSPYLLSDSFIYIWYLFLIGFMVYLSVSELRAALVETKAARQLLSEQNAVLRREMVASETVRQQQDEFTLKLHAVTNSANELMQCETIDDLWKSAVQTARQTIGLQRCSIFLLDSELRNLSGTYGITSAGALSAEHRHVIPLADSAVNQDLLRAVGTQEAIWAANQDTVLNEWNGAKSTKIGRGWMVNTLIRPQQGAPLALFFNDAGLSRQPFDESKQELLGVFCTLLANVAQRKTLEMQQRQQTHGLRQVVASADELLNTTSLQEFWARAVRLGHKRLGVERMAIYTLEVPATGLFRGTYGIDLNGQVVEIDFDSFWKADWEADYGQRRTNLDQADWRYVADADTSDIHEGRMLVVGRGWVVNTPIFSDTGRLMGILFNDTGISFAPMDPEQQALINAYARLLGNMAERKQALERQEQVSADLRDVLTIADKLMACPTIEDLWRAAVELARERLGVERGSIFLIDPQQPERLTGTFGTDILHKTTDERGASFVSDEFSETIRRYKKGASKVWQSYDNVMHKTWHVGRYLDVQIGWVVNTPITNSKGEVVGAFFNDTAITRKALDSNQQDVIAIYCRILGSIVERKQIEQHLQNYSVTLENSVQERTLQLQHSEKYFRTIIQQSGDVISVIGLDGTITFESPSSQEVFGHTGRIGQNSFDLIHPDDVEYIARVMMGQISITILPNTVFAVRVKHVDGRWLDTESKISLLYDDDQQIQAIVVNARDVTERKQREVALQRRVAFEHALAEISTRLTLLPLEQIEDGIDFAIEKLGIALHLDTCRLNEPADQNGKIIVKYDLAKMVISTHEWLTPELAEWPDQQLKGIHRPIPAVEWWGMQFNMHQPIVISDITALPEEAQGFKDARLCKNIHALLAVPLWVQNEKMGLLVSESRTQRTWLGDEIQLMSMVGEVIASTLKRRQAGQALQSRLDMEHTVAMISGKFAVLSAEDMSAGINFALHTLGTGLQVDMCRVFQYDLDRQFAHNTHEWCAPGVASIRDQLQNLDMRLPGHVWFTKQHAGLGHLHFSNITDMPDEAKETRARMIGLGVRSMVRVPLLINDQIVGELGLDTIFTTREWADEDLGLLQVIAENISSALARQRSSDDMQRRVQFEQLVADISGHFLQLPPERQWEGIDHALGVLGEFTGVSICRLFEYSADGLISSNTHEWCAPGVASQMANLRMMQRNPDSWWQQQLHTRELIYYSRLDQMPEEAAGFKAILDKKGVKALISIALRHNQQALGELGLDSLVGERSWRDEDVRLLRLITELITNALIRQRAQQRLQAQIDSEQLVADISSTFVRMPVDKIDSGIQTALRLVGQYAQVDICSLYEISKDRLSYSNTHEWCGAQISSQMDMMQNQPLVPELWWWQALEIDRIIKIDQVSESEFMPEDYRQEWMSRGIHSSLAIAIFQHDVLIGELGLDIVMRTQLWSEDVLRVIEVVADLIGNALTRKRDAQALQHEHDLLEMRVVERTNEINKLLDVSKTVNSTLELQPLLNLILDQLKGVVDYDALAISEFNETASKILLFEGPMAVQPTALTWSYDVEQDVHITELIVHRSPLIVPDVRAETPFAQAVRWRYTQIGARVPDYMTSILYVPLVVRDRVIGIMALYSAAIQFYTPHHAQLAIAFANQAAVAIENARLYEQAVQSAALTERSRLARELHDSVSQALFGIVLGARTVLHNSRKADSKILEPMEYVMKLSEAALAEMRALIFELRPESLQNEGLLIAFQKQAEALCARHRIDVQTDLGNHEPPISLSAKEALYRIGLEAVQNTIKHAAASRIDLRLRVLNEHVVLEVHDNGRGFDMADRFPGHFGLSTMRERAEQLGGIFDLSSTINQGTTVQVSLPIQPERTPSMGQQPLAV